MEKLKANCKNEIEKDRQKLLNFMHDNISEEMEELLDEELYVTNTEENNNFKIITRGDTIDAN